MKCPKCGYVRQPQDEAPDYECPKCGVVYAKVVARFQDAGVSAAFSKPLIEMNVGHFDARGKQILVAFAISAFIGGYVVGREHIKYEMRSALENAGAGIRNVLGGSAERGAKPPPKPNTAQTYPVTANLLRKSVRSLDYGRNEVTFAVNFSNATGRDIRAFDGTLTFTDLLGNEILGAKLAVNDLVTAGGSLEWEGKLDYNQFISSHEQLRNADTQNIKVSFALKKALYSDGTTEDFQE